jgi:hypothetical protein
VLRISAILWAARSLSVTAASFIMYLFLPSHAKPANLSRYLWRNDRLSIGAASANTMSTPVKANENDPLHRARGMAQANGTHRKCVTLPHMPAIRAAAAGAS